MRKNRPPTRRRPGDIHVRASDVAVLIALFADYDEAIDVRDGEKIVRASGRIVRLLRQPVGLGAEEITETRRRP